MFRHRLRAIEARRLGHDDRRHHIALILVGNEARRQYREQVIDAPQEKDEQNECNDHSLDHEFDGMTKATRHRVDLAVEPRKESALRRWRVLQQDGAHCGGQRQCHEAGHRHRYDDRDGELFVELARGSRQKRRRNEHRRHHQHDGDQRAGDLLHRLDRRVLRLQIMLRHIALDVLDDDDRVVDDHADRQDQSEKRKQIDRKTEREHPRERGDQRDDDRDRADDRRAQALQKQVDDEHDQHDRLDQRVDHLLDRQSDEVVRVERDDVIHPFGKS